MALTIGACVLPLSVAYAQDFRAIERRLGRAVEAGEITLEQAKGMMDTLRRGADRQGRDQRALIERFAEGKRRIKAAVEKGDLSPEEAEKKIIAMRESMFGNKREESHEHDREHGRDHDRDEDALKRRYVEAQRRIEAAVKDGKVSRENAEKRLIGLRKSMFGERREESRERNRDRESHERDRDEGALRRRYAEAQREIEAAVKKGDLSREDAEKKLIELRKKMFR